ncbi:MAG: L-aspartate aminotransferase apoenzyme [Candidatus Angelobacter sp.]|jgi:aspartate aminotransferase|nr:L-aspartate aminotransferase apoenzyme [Candidatus Angelobacter sp.]
MSATATGKLVSDRINRIEISATLAVVNEAAQLRAKGADLVDFGAGEPHFSTPRHIKDAGIAAINNDFTKYTAVAGIAELREAIVKRHAADFGSNYAANESIASTGGKLALFNAIQTLVDHGDEVIIPVPYWVSFKDIVQYAGGTCVYVETEEEKGFQLTAGLIERAITDRTKVIILNTPGNPSGAVMDPNEMRELVRLAHRRGIYVICDECYVYLNYAGTPVSAGAFTDCKEHLVIIGSLSKTYAMTGWRMGYALAPLPILNAMQKLQSQSTSSSNAIVQKAAVAAMNGPQDCIAEMKSEYIKLRDRVLAGLAEIPGIKCQKPQGAFYVYPNVSAFFGKKGINSAADVARKLLHEAHVVTVPGDGFGTSEHIRISYAVAPKELEHGIERMKKFFGEL